MSKPPRRRKAPLINPKREGRYFPEPLCRGLRYVHWCTIGGRRYCMGWSRTLLGHHEQYVTLSEHISEHRAYHRSPDVEAVYPEYGVSGVAFPLPWIKAERG